MIASSVLKMRTGRAGETDVKFFRNDSIVKSERMMIIKILNVRAPIDLDGKHPGTTLIIANGLNLWKEREEI